LDLPSRMAAYRDGTHRMPWRDMSGEQFLYSEYALGLPVDLIAKIRQLIDGKGLRRRDAGGRDRPVRWATLGQAVDAFPDAYSKNLWGPQQSAQFAKLIERLPASVSNTRPTPAKAAAAIPQVARRRPSQQ
jgi:hypothetical protein